jgi:hypothetical protein
MKLIFKGGVNLSEYHNGTLGLHLLSGQEFEVGDDVGAVLIKDFGPMFAEVKPAAVAQAPAGPMEHRQIVEPPRRGRTAKR